MFNGVDRQAKVKLLPARASEQGNVIGSVRLYITEKPFTS